MKGSEEIRVFRGRARQAILAFPQNINVAALLSLAGLGQDKTTVEIWTSKAYRYNRHEIEIEYKGGALRIQAENKPSAENPKTSALAMYSAVAALRKFFSSVKTGT